MSDLIVFDSCRVLSRDTCPWFLGPSVLLPCFCFVSARGKRSPLGDTPRPRHILLGDPNLRLILFNFLKRPSVFFTLLSPEIPFSKSFNLNFISLIYYHPIFNPDTLLD